MENSEGAIISEEENPLPEFMDAATFRKLQHHRLIDEVGLRNYCITRKYHCLKLRGLSMFDCLENLSREYGLSIEYLRKMVGIKVIYFKKKR
ncbi:MAG: hypothetical protein HF314_11730 [Ignavibacteria bacterium]|jgi:hypothetical protein|nr:hypothetical protein [Ignavibacteria bacterium]MCU7503740.1 hypothetical protein [Ignavibacteria bacterium]MCU7517614.1 hypothetical protein [Ignavibacteria bacterium]